MGSPFLSWPLCIFKKVYIRLPQAVFARGRLPGNGKSRETQHEALEEAKIGLSCKGRSLAERTGPHCLIAAREEVPCGDVGGEAFSLDRHDEDLPWGYRFVVLFAVYIDIISSYLSLKL